MKSSSKWRHSLELAAVNIFVLVVLLLTIEIGARTYATIFKGKTFFRPRVNSPWISAYDQPFPRYVDGGGVFQQNDRVVPFQKPGGEYRIVAVGGSTTVGKDAFRMGGVDYPRALEQLLNQRGNGKRFVVLNAGGDGYSTVHSLINIATRILEFDPDLVILMEGINDYSVGYFGPTVRSDYSNKYMSPYFIHPQLQVTSSLFGFLSQSRLLSSTAALDRLGRDFDRSLPIDDVIPHFQRHMASTHAILEKHGVELLILSQAHQRTEGPKDTRDAAMLAAANRAYAAAEGVPFVDLFEIFGQEKQYFLDLVHHTPAGVKRVAELITPTVLQIASRDTTPPSRAH